jgi:O-antigen ligase
MSDRQRFLELLALGTCAFILTQALLSLILDPGDTPTEGNPVWKLLLCLSYLSVAAILIRNSRETLFLLHRNWSLVALVLLALVSCAWAATPALVLQRSIAVLGTTLLGIALAVRLPLEDQLRLMSWLFRIIAVLSLACVLLLPSYGIYSGSDGGWRGIFGYKNNLGAIMALSLLVEWQLPAQTGFSKLLNRFALLLSAVLLVFSNTITPMVALVACMLFVQIYKFAMRLRIPLYAIVLATLLVIASGVTMLSLDSERVTAVLGRSSDLTGRTQIWALVTSYIPERPILGYGYSGFWHGASPESLAIDRALGVEVMYSHNGYLEILLNLGAVGFLLMLAFLGTGMKRAVDHAERDQSSLNLWPLAFLSFSLLRNLGEASILCQDLEWALCVAAIVGADAALCTSHAGKEEQSLLVPSEEFS